MFILVPGRTLLGKAPWNLSPNTCDLRSDIPEEDSLIGGEDEIMDITPSTPVKNSLPKVSYVNVDHDYIVSPVKKELPDGSWDPGNAANIKWELPSPSESFGLLGEGYKNVLGFKNEIKMEYEDSKDRLKSAIGRIQMDENFFGIKETVEETSVIVDGTWSNIDSSHMFHNETRNFSVVVPSPGESSG